MGTDELPYLYVSEKYGLSGRPDFVLEIGRTADPGDLKTGRTPKGPLFSHILQVAAYCLLIARTSGKTPSVRSAEVRGAWSMRSSSTRSCESILLDKLEEMREHDEERRGAPQSQPPGQVRQLLPPGRPARNAGCDHSTVTLLARFLGLSMEQPLFLAT